jgi:hypothetical protein
VKHCTKDAANCCSQDKDIPVKKKNLKKRVVKKENKREILKLNSQMPISFAVFM